MEKPKTAEEVLHQEFDRINASKHPAFKQALYEAKYKNNSVIRSAMKAHTRQAIEAYRDEVMDGLEYEDANRIQQINIDDYLK